MIDIEIISCLRMYGLIAYIDPGTGSMVLQALIAGIVGAAFAIKLFWKNITIFVSGLFGKKSKESISSTPVDSTEDENEKNR